MGKEGLERLEILGVEDKRKIIAIFAGTVVGDVLYPQMAYARKTMWYLPSFKVQSSWHVTHTETHWANQKTTEYGIQLILLPYTASKRSELSL